MCISVRAELSTLAPGPFAPWFNVCIVGSVVRLLVYKKRTRDYDVVHQRHIYFNSDNRVRNRTDNTLPNRVDNLPSRVNNPRSKSSHHSLRGSAALL